MGAWIGRAPERGTPPRRITLHNAKQSSPVSASIGNAGPRSAAQRASSHRQISAARDLSRGETPSVQELIESRTATRPAARQLTMSRFRSSIVAARLRNQVHECMTSSAARQLKRREGAQYRLPVLIHKILTYKLCCFGNGQRQTASCDLARLTSRVATV